LKTFKFELYTPQRHFYSGEIEAVTLTLTDGEITIYADHSFMVAPVMAGFIKIKTEQKGWKIAFVSEGILEVKGHNTIVMADAAEWPEEIDRERAEKSLKAAEEMQNAGNFKFETSNAEAAARRARYRLKVKTTST
jgi:F-type H+-transporting ATPase subunit epsilon